MAASSHSATRVSTNTSRLSNPLLGTKRKTTSSLLLGSSSLETRSKLSGKLTGTKPPSHEAKPTVLSSADLTTDTLTMDNASFSRSCSIENPVLTKSSEQVESANKLDATTPSLLTRTKPTDLKSTNLKGSLLSTPSSLRGNNLLQSGLQSSDKSRLGYSTTLLSSQTRGESSLLSHGRGSSQHSTLTTSSSLKPSLRSNLLSSAPLTSSSKPSLLSSSLLGSSLSSTRLTSHVGGTVTKTSILLPSSKPPAATSLVSKSHGKVTTGSGAPDRKKLLQNTQLASRNKHVSTKKTSTGSSKPQKQVQGTPIKEPDRPVTTVRLITKRTEGAPEYDFSAQRPLSPEGPKFLPPELDAAVQSPPAPIIDTVGVKTTLINAVATSLLSSPDFHSSLNPTRRSLTKMGETIAKFDPEFVLKVALYTRCDLNIRTTANFLLALASNIPACRPFLKKYYSSSIRLPSDWIEVAEIYQAFPDKSINFGSLPTALRKVMAGRFTKFDEYQLGKYNKDKAKRKKKKDAKGKPKSPASKGPKSDKPTPKPSTTTISDNSSDEEDDSVVHSDKESEEEIERLSFTLKQLVRKIHISEPVYYVMCLLGKRYPEDPETFRRSKLPGMWDQDRAGKRMKLATPETWETQVSTKGNKAKTWEDLIDHNKLPFMAMLRNIRNLILAQVSQKHHQWVMRKLNDERAVVNSRQFPFQFFSAYDVLTELEKIAQGEQLPAKPAKKGAKAKKPKELPKIEVSLLRRYRTALDNALKIATCYNVKPISGSTLILCNVGANMDRPCTSARGLGKPKTVMEVGILLGLMCKYSCEDCTMMVYGGAHFTQVELKEGTILDNMANVKTTATNEGVLGHDGTVPIPFLTNMLRDRTQIDNLVVLTDEMKLDDQQGRDVVDFLSKYRHLVNPNLLFVSVDLSSKTRGVSSTIKPTHPNDIYLAGYSDQILRFIAERGDSGQITYIENIDKAYNLESIKTPSLAETSDSPLTLAPEKALLATTQKRWRTARVFISSTFRDMHGERDMLTRFVFPELRARAHSRQINIYEVDLRWGVTEEDARSHRAMEICLSEISRCQYFIGLLGQRYGWVQEQYVIPDSPEFDWLREFPPGRSITEVEMNHAALRDTDKAVGKAFFYFRDPTFLEKVPEALKKDFESESHEVLEKIESLKSQIRFSGLEVYDRYPCQWLGVVEDKPLVGRLEDFGQRVLYNLWNAIQHDYPDDEEGQDPIAQANTFHEGFIENRATSFVGRRALLRKAQELLIGESGKVIVVAGKSGSGKSALMAAIAQQYIESDACPSSNTLLPHFIGAAPDSSNVAAILTRFCHEMKRRFGITLDIPEDYSDLAKQWPEFLQETINIIGKSSRLVVLLDGIDLLENKHNGPSMDWLPDVIPHGVTIIVSGVENGACIGNLRKRKPAPEEILIGSLDIMDKAEMVRRKLAKHRKSLEESPFNNQMKLLLTKKEASNPLYLHLACEELRVFGVFEEVTAFLKKMPPSVSNLLQEILDRLETEHSTDIVATAMSMLSLVRNGLMEHELSGVLSLHFITKSTNEEGSTLPPMVISRLLRSLQSFLQPSGQETTSLLTLAHKDIEKAVRQRYMRGTASSKEKEFHHLLASYYKNEVDPAADGSFKGNSIRAFSELPYHLMLAGEWARLEDILCNVHFLVGKCRLGLAQQLLEDYTPSPSSLPPGRTKELARFLQQARLIEFKSFVSRNLHVLLTSPSLTLQQAINEPTSSRVCQAAQSILSDHPQPLMTSVNKPESINACLMNISAQSGVATCVAVSRDSQTFAAGFKNCSVKVFEVQTGKEVHSFVGHAASITSVCFVGPSAVCSGSKDKSLSVWDVQRGIRTAVLKSHTRPIHGCAANALGDTIASVSWDTTIKVWSGKNGKLINTLKTSGQHNTPINCVAFHPEGQVIAVGSWDSTVKIWDTLNQKRIKVLKGHKSSVQACTYAPSGRHLVSASLDGEVKIWSTKSGAAVGTLVGHSLPVNSIAYTPNGQYLVTASNDKLIKVWSGSLGQPVTSLGSHEHGVIHCMTYDHSTQSVTVGYHNGHVRKFNIHSRRELLATKLHTAAVVGVAHHGSLHMSASVDFTVKIWDEQSLPKFVPLNGHSTPITCATWSKNGFATASEDLQILVWPHRPRDYSRAFRVLAGASQPPPKSKAKGKTAKQQPSYTIQPLASLHAHTAKISAISFSCDGLKMVTASNDTSLIVWDTLSHKQLRVMSACHKDWINTSAFSTSSPDFLVTGSNDFTLKLWDLKTGTAKTTFKGHTSSINSVSFHQGCIVSAGSDGSIKVWSHKGVEITTMFCHKQRVNTCLVDIPSKAAEASFDWADAVSGDDSSTMQKVKLSEISVMTASDDGTVGVWKPFLPNELCSLEGHSDRVVSIATTVNNQVLSSALDGSMRLWEPQIPDNLTSVVRERGHTGEVVCSTTVAISNKESYAATAGRDGNFIIWHIRADKQVSFEKLYTVSVSERALTALCFSSFNNKAQQGAITVGKDDGSMVTYKFSPTNYPSTTSSVSAGALMGAHPISKLVVTKDHKNIVAGSWSNQIAAVATNSRVHCRMDSHRGWVMDMAATEESSKSVVYSIGLNRELCRWEVPASKADALRAPSSTLKAPRFTIDFGEDCDKAWPLALHKMETLPYLVLSDSNGFVYLWSTSEKRVVMRRKVHKAAIRALGSTVEGELVTGSDDGTVKMWRVREKKAEISQIGQFYCQSCVACIAVVGGKNVDTLVVVGDSLGHVTLIKWTR